MTDFVLIDRRLFLRRLGKGALAMSIVGSTTTGSSNGSTATFHRVNLGAVSAYLVARGNEAAVVDTGLSGNGGAIARALGEIGLDWNAVGHVILTHRHHDHVGSLSEVLDAAPGATAYAGADDIPRISSTRELSPVAQGDIVFGLRVIATPGHTAGHVSVLDESASVLVVGDALNGVNGGVSGPNPRFTDDMTVANQSVQKLASLSFETAYFGHGEPVMVGASALVADLAATL